MKESMDSLPSIATERAMMPSPQTKVVSRKQLHFKNLESVDLKTAQRGHDGTENEDPQSSVLEITEFYAKSAIRNYQLQESDLFASFHSKNSKDLATGSDHPSGLEELESMPLKAIQKELNGIPKSWKHTINSDHSNQQSVIQPIHNVAKHATNHLQDEFNLSTPYKGDDLISDRHFSRESLENFYTFDSMRSEDAIDNISMTQMNIQDCRTRPSFFMQSFQFEDRFMNQRQRPSSLNESQRRREVQSSSSSVNTFARKNFATLDKASNITNPKSPNKAEQLLSNPPNKQSYEVYLDRSLKSISPIAKYERTSQHTPISNRRSILNSKSPKISHEVQIMNQTQINPRLSSFANSRHSQTEIPSPQREIIIPAEYTHVGGPLLEETSIHHFKPNHNSFIGTSNRFEFKEFPQDLSLNISRNRHENSLKNSRNRRNLTSQANVSQDSLESLAEFEHRVQANYKDFTPLTRSVIRNRFDTELFTPFKGDRLNIISNNYKDAVINKITQQVSHDLDRLFESYRRKVCKSGGETVVGGKKEDSYDEVTSFRVTTKLDETYRSLPYSTLRERPSTYDFESGPAHEGIMSPTQLQEKELKEDRCIEISELYALKQKKIGLTASHSGEKKNTSQILCQVDTNSPENMRLSSMVKDLNLVDRLDVSQENKENSVELARSPVGPKSHLLVPKGEELPQIDETRNEIPETEFKDRSSLLIDDIHKPRDSYSTNELANGNVNVKLGFDSPQKNQIDITNLELEEEFYTPRHEITVDYENLLMQSSPKNSDYVKRASDTNQASLDEKECIELKSEHLPKSSVEYSHKKESPSLDGVDDSFIRAKSCEPCALSTHTKSEAILDRSIKSEPVWESPSWVPFIPQQLPAENNNYEQITYHEGQYDDIISPFTLTDVPNDQQMQKELMDDTLPQSPCQAEAINQYYAQIDSERALRDFHELYK